MWEETTKKNLNSTISTALSRLTASWGGSVSTSEDDRAHRVPRSAVHIAPGRGYGQPPPSWKPLRNAPTIVERADER
jgi:hypothetical protein